MITRADERSGGERFSPVAGRKGSLLRLFPFMHTKPKIRPVTIQPLAPLRLPIKCAVALCALAMVFDIATQSSLAQNGSILQTPPTPMELPVEVEIELSPAGSLKQAALWKELVQLLENPYAPVQRRPSFTATPLPPLNMYPLYYNFLTGQPMRVRTSDGEVSWDQPGPMFDPEEDVQYDAFTTPTLLRTSIGHLVAVPGEGPYATLPYAAADIPEDFYADKPAGSLVIFNPDGNPLIPPHGTVVAVPAYDDGVLLELDPASGELEEVVELEQPVNEEHFFRDPDEPADDVHPALQSLVGRPAAEILGKALFWDMQIGSDSVQSCGSCHFHAGVDNRTKGQLNSGLNAGDITTLDVFVQAGLANVGNQEIFATNFPFRKLPNPDQPSEIFLPNGRLQDRSTRDANDVMSSMGVSRFKLFNDVPVGAAAFISGTSPGVLAPDFGTVVADPVPINEGFRRIEPRNTPTFHGAAFNLDNFWDGRARFVFNGGSVFGASDPTKHIFVNDGTAGGALHGLPDPFDNELPLNEWANEGSTPELSSVPARIKFSSLGSQSVGPPLSDFEMSFSGRNWQKIGKKLLQDGVTPLANQNVSPTDSRLGPFARPDRGLTVTYADLIKAAFAPQLWANTEHHFVGAPGVDPFDGFVLGAPVAGAADPNDTFQFTQMEANFSSFFALSIQAYEALVIPDDTPADRFFDANPNAGHGVGEPGDQAVLFPTLIPDLVADGVIDGNTGFINLVPDNPTTLEWDGFGPDEVFGFDLFAGANLTAALAPNQAVANNPGGSGRNRNPLRTITTENGQRINIRVGSNPFTRSAKCMLCHLGPEQTDHSINISHGLLKNDAEFEYPVPPRVPDPLNIFADGMLPAPEPSGSSSTVGGLILSEEVTEGPPQDAVEVEPRNFATLNLASTPWDDRIISQPDNFAFGDQGVYNIGLRPINEDIGRGGDDPFGWPLSLSALTLKNIGGADFEPYDSPTDPDASPTMANFDPFDIGATFEETGDGAFYPGTTYDLQSVNPGFERRPIEPQLPDYLAPWVNDLPAGELHPQIDEMAGMVPNTITPPNGGPGIEFPEVMFGADQHCARYDPTIFGFGPPSFGWGPPTTDDPLCPQHQSGVAGNFAFPSQGTWPVPNRVLREGAFKAPPLRNVELTGPYFHTGSYLTLRQVVDFYFRGGDFPISTAENRDPHIVDVFNSAFAFGRTTGDDLSAPVSWPAADPILISDIGFADGLPDPVFTYDQYPDSDHPFTPEPDFGPGGANVRRNRAIEDAKNSLVKFLLALTDARVKYERAPFDRPQLFVPIDGTAPDNTAGPAALAADARFLNLPAVGAGGRATALPSFLGISRTVVAGPNNDHFDP